MIEILQLRLTVGVADLFLVRCVPRNFVSALLAVAFCSCHSRPSLPDTSPEAGPVRWLDHTDVIADFTERVERQHDYRFVSVFAFSRKGALQPAPKYFADQGMVRQKHKLSGRKPFRDPCEQIVMLRKILENRLATEENDSIPTETKICSGFCED